MADDDPAANLAAMNAEAAGSPVLAGDDGSEPSRAAVTVAPRSAGTGGRIVIVHADGGSPEYLGSSGYGGILVGRKVDGQLLRPR